MPKAEGLRVALIAGTLGRGGAEKQLFYVATSLLRAGVDVALYCLTRGEDYEMRLSEAGLAPCWIGRFGNPLIRLADLTVRLRRFRPHVVQATHGFTNPYAALAARAAGAVSLGAVRANLAGMMQDYGLWTRRLLRAPHAVIANSETAISEIVSNGLLPCERVYLLRNAVDLREYDASPGLPDNNRGARVIFLARLIPCKKGDRFLRALAIARSTDPDIVGWVAGDGPERERLERLAADLGLLPGGVRFLGLRSDIPSLLQRVEMLALTSDSEGSPNAVLEGMAAGLPVISTPAGDAARLVQDGVTGYIVPFDDVAGLARCFTLLARDPRRRRELGHAGRRRVEEIAALGDLATRLLSIYASAARTQQKNRVLAAIGAQEDLACELPYSPTPSRAT